MFARNTLCAFAVLFAICAIAACSDDNPSDTGMLRKVDGLEICSLKIEGYYYVASPLPYEGAWAVGDQTEPGILIAIQEINAAGGVHGKPLGLVVCNTKGDGTVATQIMNELADTSTVSATTCCMRSAATIPAAEVASTRGLVMVAPGATSPAITDLADNGWVSRTAPSDAQQGVVDAALARREGWNKVFVPTLDDPWATGIQQVFIAEFTALGGEAVASVYSGTDANFAQTIIDEAMAYGPDAVFLARLEVDGAAIVRTAIDSGFTPSGWIFPDGLKTQGFVDAVANNQYLEGALGTVPATLGADWTVFRTTYQKFYPGVEPFSYAANAYDAIYLLAIAMELSDDPNDRTQVRDNLAKTKTGQEIHPGEWSKVLEHLADGSLNYEGASGAVDLDANGDVTANVEEWTIENGAIKSVGCLTIDATPCP